MAEGCKQCEGLVEVVEHLLDVAEEGPCCGSGDEMTSHYHCWQCGNVGGMYVCDALSGNPTCKPNPDNEYVKRQTVLRKAEEFLKALGIERE